MSAELGQISCIVPPVLAPHTSVYVVVHKDPLRERIDVRPSHVLHLEGDVLFLAQTTPPLSHEASGAGVEVAVLQPDEEGALRPVGYMARLLDVRENYPLDDGHSTATALAVSAPGPTEYFETSLRMHHRVPLDEHMGVFLRLADPEGGHAAVGPDGSVSPMTGFEGALIEGVELLDFSAGGARVRIAARMGSESRFEVGKTLPFRLIFVGSGFAEGLAVVRSQDIEIDPDGRDMRCLGLSFTNMEIRDIRYLERMVSRTVSACRQREKDASYT
jgi:hypothetical protein